MKKKTFIILSAFSIGLAAGNAAMAGEQEKATETKAAMEEAVPAEYVEEAATKMEAAAEEKAELMKVKHEEGAMAAEEAVEETPETAAVEE